MILHEVVLRNVGVYGPEQRFVLTPRSDGRFSRPITLLRGKNGVGKSTLMEAVRHGLHGALVLGDRTAQADYETYLRKRIYRPTSGPPPQQAAIELLFEMVFSGTRHRYRVVRGWDVSRKAVAVDLRIYEDERLLPEADGDAFLRDLIDPGLADLFFFDGEKIRTLAAAGERGDALMADTVRQLLGLQMVEQLHRDLGVYLTRKDVMHELSELTVQLGRVESEIDTLDIWLEQLRDKLDETRRERQRARGRLRHAEQKLEREGSTYAEQRQALSLRGQELTTRIAATQAHIHELCRGVLPFAMVPDLLRDVREQLLREESFERWSLTHAALAAVRDGLQEAGVDAALLDRHFARYATPPLADESVIHRVSAETRRQMLGWIDEALHVTPRQLTQALADLEQLENSLATVRAQLAQVPDESLLAPLRSKVIEQQHAFWSADHEEQELQRRLAAMTEQRRTLVTEQHLINDQIARSEADSTPLKLAARTRQLLEAYKEQLTAAKLSQVEERLTARFTQLCRKRNFVDRVAIDPESFAVTLYRGGEAFARSQLSAGEKQLFAIATLWALREVSNRPLPVLIDTPLARLDSEHRQAMLTEFFPHVAHQTIMLATDAEVDDAFLDDLRPALSHFYQLTFDEGIAATETRYQDPRALQPALIGFDDISVRQDE